MMDISASFIQLDLAGVVFLLIVYALPRGVVGLVLERSRLARRDGDAP